MATSVKASSPRRYRRKIDRQRRRARCPPPPKSNQGSADASAEKIDRDHGYDDDDDLSRGLGVLETADAFVQRLADPAGADDAERRRRTDVGFEPVKRQRAPERQHLGHDSEYHLL